MKTASGRPWPGWRHLPRETRDTLFLLGVIAWTILPHLSHLPWWCAALSGLVLIWRARLALTQSPLPSRAMVVTVLVAAITATLITEHTLLGKEAGVIMLVLLMVLKTLELRARRDALVVFFLGFFLVLTNFLYSQSIIVALAMLGSVWGLLTALVLAHMPVGQPSLKQASGLAARAAMLGAPVMVVLFVLFPRIGPLWGVPQDALPKTGLSGTLRMGGVAEIANDDSIAMRIRFEGDVALPPQMLYFRGPVLSSFDGTEWRRAESSILTRSHHTPLIRPLGNPVDYEITLEPSRLPMLPMLELTPALREIEADMLGLRARQLSDLQWTTEQAVTERLRLRARAWPVFEHGPMASNNALLDYVTLPAGYNPRAIAWAAAMRRDPMYRHADAEVLAEALLAHIRANGFVYTLAPGAYGRDAIDEFWFDRKLGFCEHYAASFVVMMRALGIPARIVTGYQGADRQPVDGWWIVRQSHAHAWAEYWQRGHGWVRADPTAAVAPDRIVRSYNLQPRPGLMAGALGTVSPELLARMRRGWELVNNRWNQWVLNYSRAHQFDLLQQLGVRSPQWQDLALLLAGLLASSGLAGAAWAWWDRRRQDPWQRLLARVRAALLRLAVPVHPHDPPRTLSRSTRAALGPASAHVAGLLEDLDRLHYGPQAVQRPPSRWWRSFAQACGHLNRLQR